MAGKFILKVDSVKISEDRSLELLAGTNVTLTAVDTEGDHQSAQVTIAASSGSGIVVQEEDVTVDAAATTLDFDGSDFNLASEAGNEVRIGLAYGSGAGTPAEGNHTHAGAGHTIADAGVAETQRATLDFQDGFEVADNAGANSTDVDLSYGAAGYPLDVAAAEADGTAITVPRADHVHAHGSGYLPDAHHAQAHSGSDHTDPAAATTVDIGDVAAAGTGTNPPAADDHTHGVPAPGAGYPLDTTFAAEADGTATTPARSDHRHTITDPTTLPGTINLDSETSTEGVSTDVARADHSHGIATDDGIITLSSTYKTPAVDSFIVWRAPYACTVTALRGYVDAGTTTVINAFKGSLAAPTNFSTADMTITSADTWISDTTLDVTAVASGDAVGFEIQTAGTAAEVSIQLDLTRP